MARSAEQQEALERKADAGALVGTLVAGALIDYGLRVIGWALLVFFVGVLFQRIRNLTRYAAYLYPSRRL